MNKEQGITTTSIIIYVIAMMIVIGIIASITSFFYSNVNNVNQSSEHIGELTKFHMYFLEETMKQDNDIYQIKDTAITFLSGNTFTFQDNSIYLNQIKICEDISNVQFAKETKNGKTIVKVLITIGNTNEYSKMTQYVLNTDM